MPALGESVILVEVLINLIRPAASQSGKHDQLVFNFFMVNILRVA